METTEVNPNVSNFVNSLRAIGYTFEIAVADVLDNCISADASEIKIFTAPDPELILCMLDNGVGMSNSELTEAMRLATKSPSDEREKKDLGRFGLGLKTASFSQCKKLTVLSKKDGCTSIKQWDLDYISTENKWLLITSSLSDFNRYKFVDELDELNSGTLVIWEEIDGYKNAFYSSNIEILKKHLSLVFHRFIDGEVSNKKLKISVNNSPLKAFNPFNETHDATFQKSPTKISIYDSLMDVTPYILPDHRKVSKQEWDQYATEDGYIKSQGFYLYREGRLLIHGTWWGMHKAIDAHKLVRIKIDISNDQDKFWGIDIKKSMANPRAEIKKELKVIIAEVTKESLKPIKRKANKLKDKTTTHFWDLIPLDEKFQFGVNKDHPVYTKLIYSFNEEQKNMFELYLKGLQAYLPIESIQAQLQQHPHQIDQKEMLSENDIKQLVEALKRKGLTKEYIEELLKTEIFKNKKEMLDE